MDWMNVAVIVLIVAFLVWRMMPTKGVSNITTIDLRKQLNEKNKQYIDVRTPGEYKSHHIKGFKNIPLQELTTKASQLSKEKEVIVICQSGMRSNKASKLLKKMGFQQVTNVKGGMSTWS
ncbi:rhodanese-like domain-containing protein [Bacillus massiliigorillae]|uniref:rhodanese-like domain-containing protein n=1 Tax=Bacillus massiliigorillae TaxID=1243664 RepID=UPI0003A61568|nr:rhodanese-like domain-containing protein [Bacillus massiliigorillae]